jgi:hypothetical protein
VKQRRFFLLGTRRITHLDGADAFQIVMRCLDDYIRSFRLTYIYSRCGTDHSERNQDTRIESILCSQNNLHIQNAPITPSNLTISRVDVDSERVLTTASMISENIHETWSRQMPYRPGYEYNAEGIQDFHHMG